MSSHGSTTQHNYYDSPPSLAWMVTITDFVGLGLATLVVFARCYTKFLITKAPGWEDYVCLMSYATFVGYVSAHLIERVHFGAGRHTYDIPLEYWRGYLHTAVTASYTYVIGITLAKISLLLFLYRIFRVERKFCYASWVIGGVITIWSTVSLLLCIFACRPVNASFDYDTAASPTTVCPIKTVTVLNIHGICNIITDFALLILPAPMVWNLHVTTKKRVGLAIVFATGIFLHLSIEFYFSIIVACLPVLTPLIKRLSIVSSWFPSLRSKITGSSPSSGDASKRLKISKPDQDHDIERNALRTGVLPASSWQTPRAWKEAPKRKAWDDIPGDGDDGTVTMKSESDITLQELQRIESDGVGENKKGDRQGLKDFLADELQRKEDNRGGR
ncbi:MAG: hypothetical protein Q9169_007630 [Polycauliona sp. 2 TL-2023]